MAAILWALHALCLAESNWVRRACRCGRVWRPPWSWENSASTGGIAGCTRCRCYGSSTLYITARWRWTGWSNPCTSSGHCVRTLVRLRADVRAGTSPASGRKAPRHRAPADYVAGTIWGFFIHANVGWRFGWLEWIVSTPHFHHWHHTQEDHINRNYASMLPIMDVLFGTSYLPKIHWPAKYGIQATMSSNVFGQLIDPFTSPAQPQPQVALSSTGARASDISS